MPPHFPFNKEFDFISTTFCLLSRHTLPINSLLRILIQVKEKSSNFWAAVSGFFIAWYFFLRIRISLYIQRLSFAFLAFSSENDLQMIFLFLFFLLARAKAPEMRHTNDFGGSMRFVSKQPRATPAETLKVGKGKENFLCANTKFT